MNKINFLSLVQRQTNTEPVVIDEAYKAVFLSLYKPDYDEPDSEQLSKVFDEAIEKYKSVELPTPYESIVHYPGLLNLLEELYSVGLDLGLFEHVNPDFKIPLIGTANLASMGAYAKTDYSTIIIDRGLLFFFSNMSRLLTDIIISEEESAWVIRPNLLTMEEIQNRILSNLNIIRDFTEIMTSYVKYGTTIPFSHRMKFHNTQKSKLDNLIGLESWRFIVAHEMMHLLYNHRQSTPSVELEADRMATQLCAKCVEKLQAETQLYWVPVFVTATLDILMECNDIRGIENTTHPKKRGEYAHHIIGQMEAGGYALAMAQAVRRILLLLWSVTKRTIIGLANDDRIKDPEQLRRVISLIDFTS